MKGKVVLQIRVALCLLIFSVSSVIAQPTYQVDIHPPDGVYDTSANLNPGDTVVFDIHLTGQTAAQNGGGFYLDWSDQSDALAYVSVVPAEEANGGPWMDGAGNILNEVNGPGTIAVLLGSLSGAAPDGFGNLLLGTVTLEYNAPGAGVTVDITDVPRVTEWAPIDETTFSPGVFTLQQGGCTVDADCADDGLFCNGDEICDEESNECLHSGNPCSVPTPVCDEETDLCEAEENTTTTTTTSSSSTSCNCPPLCIFGEDSEEVELLRYFRDEVLKQTTEGQEIIRLYYQWSPTIIKALEADQAFKEKVKEMIDELLSMIEVEVE